MLGAGDDNLPGLAGPDMVIIHPLFGKAMPQPPNSQSSRTSWAFLGALVLLLAALYFAMLQRSRDVRISASADSNVRAAQPAAKPSGEGEERPVRMSAKPSTAQPPDAAAGIASGTTNSPVTPFAHPPAPLNGIVPEPASAVRDLSDILQSCGDLSVPENRARAARLIAAEEKRRKDLAVARANAEGRPLRKEFPDGRVIEVKAIEDGELRYRTTFNTAAAISNGASLLAPAPYSLTGAGLTAGIWDGGSVRATHQEFGGRITVKDGSAAIDHGTHVGGTMAASGVVASARGMAPALKLDSYDWNSDNSELTSRGATYPGEPGKLQVSNHSYGVLSGWAYTGVASPMWEWYGSGTTTAGTETDFGKYETNARDTDSLAVSMPYLLMFRAAGNERGDTPVDGNPVALSPGGAVVTYSAASHPPADGAWKSGGYETMSFDEVSKNTIAIGAVNDAVSAGVRQPAFGTMSWFSSWGATDDGRIKPDIVANGVNVNSSTAGSDTSYNAFFSGTSMAAPSASGAAMLLVQQFGQSFPGQAMRASTLKALLIHTATDIGTAGPDYQNGYGLMNAKAAADHIRSYATAAGLRGMTEDRLTTTQASRTFTFNSTGAPIRATLCWTDPAGTATTTTDSRTVRLVNNLNLTITGPGGTTHLPYVMPYTTSFDPATLASPAVQGVNTRDNVEQVFIAAPAAGAYTVQVNFGGTLSGSAQVYSLMLSGADSAPPAAPLITAISPATTPLGSAQILLNLTSANITLGATVKLTRAGQSDVTVGNLEVMGDLTRGRFNTAGMVAGLWNVVVTNPDGQTFTLPDSFTVVGALWADDLESSAAGWTHSAITGTDGWALTTAQSRSATHSWFAAGPAARTDNPLVSPAIAVPAGASSLQLSFWHRYGFQSNRDGGVLEFSIDGGAWFDVTSAGSGASFALGGYGNTMNSTSSPINARRAWSGTLSTFSQVKVDLTDAAKYAGKSLRIRWRLTTNSSTASTGWYIDDISLAGAAPVNAPPEILTEPAAAASPVTGTSTVLHVTATDDAGEPALTYLWSVNAAFEHPVTFTENGTNAAKQTEATFTAPGTYTFSVQVRDEAGLSVTGTVDVTVDATLTAISVSPATATVTVGQTQLFAVAAQDQFGLPMAAPSLVWSAAGGTIDAAGLFIAGMVPGGPFIVTAQAGALAGNASVTITGTPWSSWQTETFSPAQITAGTAAEKEDPDQDGITNLLEYALGTPPLAAGPLPFSAPIVPDEPPLTTSRRTLSYSRPAALPGISYIAEVSADLTAWSPANIVSTVLSPDGRTEAVVAEDPVSADSAERRYIRLRVERVP